MSIAEQVLSFSSTEPQVATEQKSDELDLGAILGEKVTPENEGIKIDEAPLEPKQDDPRLSMIAKLERKLKMEQQEFKRQKQELDEKLAKLKEWEELENEQDPLKLISKKGWDLEKINKYAMENLNEEELDPLAKKLKEIEATLSKKDQEWEEKLQKAIAEKENEIKNKQYEMEIQQFKGDIKSFLSQNKDDFELVTTYEAETPEGKIDGISLVYDVIYADLQRQVKNGLKNEELQPLDVKLAAEKVEQYLDSQVQKYLNLNKYKSKKSPEETALESFLGQSNTPKTLDSSFVPKSKTVDELSDKEREQRAIELIKRGFNS